MHPWLNSLVDRRDDRRARSLRAQLGRLRRLVSWHDLGEGRWLARLSGPDRPETVEGLGRSRCEAIRDAERALSG